jgi:aminoglycoside-2''-adenylyltransferase
MMDAAHLGALRLIHECLEGSGVDWAVTGSLGMALQGLDLPANDIDLQTDRSGAYEIERRLSAYVVTPVRYVASDRMRSHLGKLLIQEIEVEIIGDVQKWLEDGTWEEPVPVGRHKHWIKTDGIRIPILSLEHEYEAYRAMGRLEKAELLRKYLDRRLVR